MYYHPETNATFELHSDVRRALQWVLFGDTISDDDLVACGVYPLVSMPPALPVTQVAEPLAIELIDGAWTQTWRVRDRTTEELEQMKPQVPQQITSGQGREALYNVGLFANVQPTIDSIEDPDTKWRVQNAWDYRPTWERQSPFVEMMAGILGLSAEQADQLFITAASL